MGIMAIINLPVIVILGRTAMRALQDYMEQRRAGKNPVFKASSIGLKEKTDFWQLNLAGFLPTKGPGRRSSLGLLSRKRI